MKEEREDLKENRQKDGSKERRVRGVGRKKKGDTKEGGAWEAGERDGRVVIVWRKMRRENLKMVGEEWR